MATCSIFIFLKSFDKDNKSQSYILIKTHPKLKNADLNYCYHFIFSSFLPKFASSIELQIYNKTNDMLPFDIQTEELQKGELEKVATILTNSFETNPAYSLIFTRRDKLREGLFWLFKTNLFLLNRSTPVTKVVKEKKTGEIIGVFSLLPPGGVKSEPLAYFQIGIFGFIKKFGFHTLHKMLGMDSFNKKLLIDAIGTNEYYYLSMVVVKEEYRGTGIGSFMIKNCIEELRLAEKKCNIVGLTTQLPENVTFYSRLGFQTLDEGEVRFKHNSYYNYNMKLDL